MQDIEIFIKSSHPSSIAHLIASLFFSSPSTTAHPLPKENDTT